MNASWALGREGFIISKSGGELAAQAAEAIQQAMLRVQLLEKRLEKWRAAMKAREKAAPGVDHGDPASEG